MMKSKFAAAAIAHLQQKQQQEQQQLLLQQQQMLMQQQYYQHVQLLPQVQLVQQLPQQGMKRPLVTAAGGAVEFPLSKRSRSTAAVTADAGGGTVGEVRFEAATSTQRALQLSGHSINGSQVTVSADPASQDGTKIIITGLPSGLQWQELKTFFSQCGTVLYADVRTPGAAPKGPPCTGQVRFETAEEAAQAQAMLDNSVVDGATIRVILDRTSSDGTKLLLTNLPAGTEWQELKDFCGQFGRVAFAQVNKVPAAARAAVAVAAPVPSIAPSMAPGMTQMAPMAAAGVPVMYVQAQPATQQHQQLQQQLQQQPRTKPPSVGEVRFVSPQSAQAAVLHLNNSVFKGNRITVKADATSNDGTKVIVIGLPRTTWQELKAHFQVCGEVAHTVVQPPPPPAGIVPSPMVAPMVAPTAAPMQMNAYGQLQVIQPQQVMVAATPRPQKGLYGEIRYVDPQHALLAVQTLNGKPFCGANLTVQPNLTSQDGTKLTVLGIPASVHWHDLKEYFAKIGPVAYAQIAKPEGGAAKTPHSRVFLDVPGIGEVRYVNASHAQVAIRSLTGTQIRGQPIRVVPDDKSQDATKVVVLDLPAGLDWHELKAHCATVGEVAYCSIIGPGEVRFETAEAAQLAIQQLNGCVLEGGYAIKVRLDPDSLDGTKVLVDNLPHTVRWQDIKDLFGAVGKVAYAARAGCR